MRRLAPELLVTAKTQRWSPEEFLRTLVEAEIAARDASNAATRRRQAGFPVTKTLDDYDLTASSVPTGHVRLPRLPGMDPGRGERVPDRPSRDREVSSAARPRLGRGRRRLPGPLPHRRRPGRHPLPRTRRQHRRQSHRHPAPQRPDHLSTNSGSHHWTTPPPNCCSGSSPPPTNAAASASDPTGPSKPGDGSCPNTPPPSACSTDSSTTATSSSPTASPTACAKPDNEEEPRSTNLENVEPGVGTFSWPPAGTTNWPLTEGSPGDAPLTFVTRSPEQHASGL